MENTKVEEMQDRLERVDILLDDVGNLLKLLNNHLEDEIPIVNDDKQENNLSIGTFLANAPIYFSLINALRTAVSSAAKDVSAAIHIAYNKDGGEI